MKELSSRLRPCKGEVPDVKNIYIEPFVKYSRSEIIKNKVRLFDFPKTFFNKLELTSKPSFNQSMSIDKGSVSYTQTLSATFGHSTEFDNWNFQKMAQQDLFVLVEFYNKSFVLMGLLNGAAMTKHDLNEKHLTSVTFEAKETCLAHYVTDIIGTKLVLVDEYNYVFQDNNNNIFNDNNNQIF